jgi:hypothetical protein
MGEVLGILEQHISELDIEKLVEYALRYGKSSSSEKDYALS